MIYNLQILGLNMNQRHKQFGGTEFKIISYFI